MIGRIPSLLVFLFSGILSGEDMDGPTDPPGRPHEAASVFGALPASGAYGRYVRLPPGNVLAQTRCIQRIGRVGDTSPAGHFRLLSISHLQALHMYIPPFFLVLASCTRTSCMPSCDRGSSEKKMVAVDTIACKAAISAHVKRQTSVPVSRVTGAAVVVQG